MKGDFFRAAMIAGTHSSVGKTTWALALMALAQRKGFEVQPFKAGPDYIDPSFHHEVCRPRKSRNLDLFLLSAEEVKRVFQRHTFCHPEEPFDRHPESFAPHSASAECGTQDDGGLPLLALVEGMMGLFDGKDVDGQVGSSAEIAKLLGLPVFLVVDGSGLATSAAAVVLGFKEFDPALDLAGVLINFVQNDGHFQWLKQAIEAKTGVPCLGYLPREASLAIPERHLGLTTALEAREKVSQIGKAAGWLEAHFEWERFLEVSRMQQKPGNARGPALVSHPECRRPEGSLRSFAEPDLNRRSAQDDGEGLRMTAGSGRPRIGVAYDRAFSFYYEDNFDLLREAGAELVFFSPLRDSSLPGGLQLLYLGGGFPEIYASRLSENRSMMDAVRRFHRGGGLLYAECGGLIYLAETFQDPSGGPHPLLGLIPGQIRMTDRLQHFGYHELETLADTFLFGKGKKLRSHEFHYSTWEATGAFEPAYRIGDRVEGFAGERILASYQHLHFGSDPRMVQALLENLTRGRFLSRSGEGDRGGGK